MKLDWSVVWANYGLLLQGAWMTIVLAVLTMLIAIPGGLLLAALRMSRMAVLRGMATAFVESFRATPLILQIYWAFYVLPATFGIGLPPFATALLALGMNRQEELWRVPGARQRQLPAQSRRGRLPDWPQRLRKIHSPALRERPGADRLLVLQRQRKGFDMN